MNFVHDHHSPLPMNKLRLFPLARACLKKAFCKMCVTVCGRFCLNEGGVAGYVNRMKVKYAAKWGVQIAGMIFQTRSNAHYIMMYLQVLRAKHCILSVLCNVWLSYVKAKIRQNLLLSFFKDCLHILADFVTLSFCHMFPKQL